MLGLDRMPRPNDMGVISHIGSERPEPGPYKCMLTLTSKTRFGAMRGCQEQSREGDLGGSPGHGWIGRPKANNFFASEVGCYSSNPNCRKTLLGQ